MQKDVFTVSRLNIEVRSALENSFPLLWVEGELSNLAQPRSGHIYFTLKDSAAQVRCALFRNRRLNLRFKPADGMQVLIRARVTLFEPRGDFQLVAEHMEPAGEGLLRQRVEALKTKLAEEGLFDDSRKRTLPPLPRRIGVVTSPVGAAVRDVITVLQRRFPAIEVVIYPTAVQGENAASEITNMIDLANRRRECDLLIVTRGGGSLEDLMAFNDETVVRAIHASSLPVISAIGHEIDVTLADFVADHRAATPSAAAEQASPDATEESTRLAGQELRILRAMTIRLEQHRGAIQALLTRLRQLHPGRQLEQNRQRLDQLEQRAVKHLSHRLGLLHTLISQLSNRLIAQAPRARLRTEQSRLSQLERRMGRAVRERLQRVRQRAEFIGRELHAVSPLATLGRGYSIIRRLDNGTVVTSSSDVVQGDSIEALLATGKLICTVDRINKE